MMQRFHGSVAKLINDTLDVRLVPFWIDSGKQNYFDGCIRDELQCRRAYRYTLTQCRRHGICSDPKDYPHTRVYLGYYPRDIAFARTVAETLRGAGDAQSALELDRLALAAAAR